MRGGERKKEKKEKKERKEREKKEKKRHAYARGHACQLLGGGGWGGEVHLFIRFEQHPKITDLFVPRAFS